MCLRLPFSPLCHFATLRIIHNRIIEYRYYNKNYYIL